MIAALPFLAAMNNGVMSPSRVFALTLAPAWIKTRVNSTSS